MFKFLLLVTMLAASFGAGYYFGQRPVGTLQQTVAHLSERWTVSQKTIADLQQSITNLSRNVIDTTVGIEQDLRRRKGLVEAKSRLVQAKIQVLDRNFGEAAKELAQAGEALEQAVKGERAETWLTCLYCFCLPQHLCWGYYSGAIHELRNGHQVIEMGGQYASREAP